MRLSYEFSNILGSVYHHGTIKFAPDAFSILSPVGNKIIVYNLKSNLSSALPLQLNYNIERISIHPRGTILLASSEKSHLYIISLTSGKLLHLKEYRKFSTITHLSFSPDGKYYCVCGDNLALVYITPGSVIAGKGRELTPFKLFRKFHVNHDVITDVSWSKDSEYLCLASQDLSINIYSINERNITTLRGHTDTIINCFFGNQQVDLKQIYSLTKNCQLYIWDQKEREEDEEEEDQNEDEEAQKTKRLRKMIRYHRSSKHYLKLTSESDEDKQSKARKMNAIVSASDYNANAKILVVGYNTGHYSLYTMPEATLIYNYESNLGSIDSISINLIGDWIAFGSSVRAEPEPEKGTNKTQSRLLVWEWQSKSHVFDQIGSGASMANIHECLSYSLDGAHVVSGNLRGQIKVWNGLNGETIAQFGEEHTGPIKAIKFVPNKSGKVIVSASLDGTVRAYDLNKFKNFRTFKSPVPEKRPEFICVDVDSTGEFIAAGTYNYFEIYLFSLQTGKFLEYLTGHEGPVSGVAFSPITNLLVSTSWDCTFKIWNLFEGSKCMRDTVTMTAEVIAVAFKPDGHQFAVSLSNGQIAIFDPHTTDQLGAPIEGEADLGTTHLVTESSRDTKKYFVTLNYSADGSYLIAAGKSNFICIYHAQEKTLVKKLPITFNMSMDGVFDYISNRRRNEFGYLLDTLESREEERSSKPIQLPGVRKGDLGERKANPVIAVNQVVFSPTMRSFAAATTEGVLIYSLDVVRHFDPYKLVIGVDPHSVQQALKSKDYGLALVQSIELNEKDIIRSVIEQVPLTEIETIVTGLEINYVKRVLDFIAQSLVETRHVEFFLIWTKKLLYRHGLKLKTLPITEITSVIRNVHQSVQRIYMNMKRNQDYCRYSLKLISDCEHETDMYDKSDVVDAECTNQEEEMDCDEELMQT